MKHSTLFLIATLLLFPAIALGFTASEVVDNQAPQAYFFPQEFDKLVLDLTIPSGEDGESDTLLAIAFKNEGSARNLREIAKVILWSDAGEAGFQGMGIDEEIGELTFHGDTYSWYLDNINVSVPEQGLRIFVSAETMKGATANTTVQFKLPLLSDPNQNKAFDVGDLGIFMESQNNGPSDDNIINQERQTIRTFIVDELAPKAVITDPLDDLTITTTTYTITGKARDQGGSTVASVKVGIALSVAGQEQVWEQNWYDATPTSDNYATWEYVWTDIAVGTSTLKTESVDWLENTAISDEITVIVVLPSEPSAEATADKEAVEEEEVGQEEGEKEPAEEEVEEPAEEQAEEEAEGVEEEVVAEEEEEAEAEEEEEVQDIEVLQTRIEGLKQKIRELLVQLIQVIEAKLVELKNQLP